MSFPLLTKIGASALLCLALMIFQTGLSQALTLTENTVWQGEIEITDDVLVPVGITLSVMPGTTIRISAAESTKTDPEYLSQLTEITVRGRLEIRGTRDQPVTITKNDSQSKENWAGIIVDSGHADIHFSTIEHSEAALTVIQGSAILTETLITANRYGIIAQGEASVVTLKRVRVTGNEYGILELAGARLESKESIILDNRQKDRFTAKISKDPPGGEPTPPVPDTAITRSYGDDVLMGTTIWQGRIMINGVVRLPAAARLIILPGTRIEFTRRDTNGDGIGENGLMIQGVLVAKGTPTAPIVFRSAEEQRKSGDWDAINVLGSDYTGNLLEYCRIEDAYRALHLHFSIVTVNSCDIANNYRGLQFQESLITIIATMIHNNKSGIRARDSEVVMTRSRVFENYSGAVFLHTDLKAMDTVFSHNSYEGLRLREGAALIERNSMTGNRFGMVVNDAQYGRYNRNLIEANQETGLVLKNTENIEIHGNAIQANGINGIAVREARTAITGNHIAANGERGIAISTFEGIITGNAIVGNGVYGIGIDSTGDVAAAENWWGGSDPGQVIYDHADESHLGRVRYLPLLHSPLPFQWPLAAAPVATSLRGSIMVPADAKEATGTDREGAAR